jgi:hypothetical protein
MITRNHNQKVRFFESLIFFSDVKLQWRRPEHDAPAIHDDADRPDDPDLAGHHHPDHRSPHVRRHVSSGLRLNAPSQLRINVASGLQRRRHRQHDSAGQHRAGVPLRPSRHDISAHLQMTEPPLKDGSCTQQYFSEVSWCAPVRGGKKTHAMLC